MQSKQPTLHDDDAIVLEVSATSIADVFTTYISKSFRVSAASGVWLGKNNGVQDKARIEFAISTMKAVATDEENSSTIFAYSPDKEEDLKILAIKLQKRLHARIVQLETRLQITRKGKMTVNAIADRLTNIGEKRGKLERLATELELKKKYVRANTDIDDLLLYYSSTVSPTLPSQKSKRRRTTSFI